MKKICLFVLIAFLSACKPKTSDDIDLFSTYNRQEMLSDLGNHVIIPTFAEASLQMDSLHLALQTFQNNPNQNNLIEAQSRWKKAFLAWQPASMYQFGILFDGGAGLLATIDNWAGNPKTMESAVSVSSIENNISGTNTLDSTYWQSLPVNQKGFPALEYLLFGDSSLSFQNPRRQAFLTLLSLHQARLLKQIHQSWIPSGGNYIANFTASDGRDAGSSLSILVNAMAKFSETLKNDKIGKPFGKVTGVLTPLATEARLSQLSLNALDRSYQGLERLLSGQGPQSSGKGINDFLRHLNMDFGGANLADAFNKSFADMYVKIDSVSIPFDQAISSQTSQVQSVYDQAKKLVVHIKVDLMTQLGIQLTYFDNDGD